MDKNETSEQQRISLHSIDSLFSDSWKLYKERWQVLVEIVLLPVLVTLLGYVLLALGSPFSIIGGIAACAGWIIFAFSTLPVIYSIHNGTGVDASYKATIGWFWPFVWLVILEVLAVLGGFVMLIIPGIFLAFALTLAAYPFVIEHRRGLDALRQSKDYVKGYWWAVVGRLLLLGLIFLVVTLVIEIPATIIGGDAGRTLATLLVTLFFVPYSAIYHYVIFENLRGVKPELVDGQPKEGKGFIMASAIVGIVVWGLLICLLIAAIAFGMFSGWQHMDRSAPPPGYGAYYPSGQ